MLVLAALAAACDDESSPVDPVDAGPSDGGGGEGGGGTPFCLDPGLPCVHYESEDVNACGTIVLGCTIDQNGFQNQCGCGCIDKGDPRCNCPILDDPAILWISMDPSQCDPTPPDCAPDDVGFSNSCGCGCIQHI